MLNICILNYKLLLDARYINLDIFFYYMFRSYCYLYLKILFFINLFKAIMLPIKIGPIDRVYKDAA